MKHVKIYALKGEYKPYVAHLFLDKEGKLQRSFFNRKPHINNLWMFEGVFPEGTVIEGRIQRLYEGVRQFTGVVTQDGVLIIRAEDGKEILQMGKIEIKGERTFIGEVQPI